MAVILHVEAGEIITGIWCPKCLKPSGFEVPVYSMFDTGISKFATMRRCDDCELPIPKDEEEE